MLKAIRSVFTAKRIEEAATMVYLKAIHGDVAAARIMFTYAAGKGSPDVDPDRLNIDEWKLTVEEAVDARDMKAIMTRLPVECANHIARATLPALGEGMMEKMGHVLRAPDSKAARRWIKKERFKAERAQREAEFKAERAQREAERARRRAERAQRQAAENPGPSADHENERTAPQQPDAPVQERRSPPLPDGRGSSAAPSPHGEIQDGQARAPDADCHPREGPPIPHGANGLTPPPDGA
jgi:hypothetical protein